MSVRCPCCKAIMQKHPIEDGILFSCSNCDLEMEVKGVRESAVSETNTGSGENG